MEQAGHAAYRVMRRHWPQAGSLVVFCGGGNNGGDGYVIARLAAADGLSVSVVNSKAVEELKGDARLAADKLLEAGISPQAYSSGLLQSADLLVDALLGTGLDREVAGTMKTWIDAINSSGKPVFSVDIPSGLSADTGQVLGTAIRAGATVTFIGLKQGLLTAQGPDCGGILYFEDLDSTGDIHQTLSPSSWRMDYRECKSLLTARQRCSHKGDFGHVLVIGGEAGFAGACRMAGEAAARTGAGLVSIATRPQNAPFISAARPELMAHGVEGANALDALLARASVIAIGPGLGQSSWSRELFARALESKLPLVVDADALNMLSVEPARSDRWILTPHPGEAARLLDCSSAEIQADRFSAITELQSRYGGVVILKGCGSLVLDEQGHLSVCSDGNPGMASGGMGDVLSGVIAGLLAQKLTLSSAARLAVSLHAHAADLAAGAGERGMLACDLMSFIRQLVNPA